MKQKRINTWIKIRSVGKGRFIFSTCCIFYCLVSIPTTLYDLWPEGKLMHFGDFLTKVIIKLLFGFLLALIVWAQGERNLKKTADISDSAV